MRIKGSIKDGKTSAPLEGVRIELAVSGQQIAVLSSDRNGQFEKGLEADLWGKALAWTMTLEGYLNRQGTLQVDQEEIPLEVSLEPEEVAEPIPAPAEPEPKAVVEPTSTSLPWWRRKITWILAGAAVILLVAIVMFMKPERHPPQPPRPPEPPVAHAQKTIAGTWLREGGKPVNYEVKIRKRGSGYVMSLADRGKAPWTTSVQLKPIAGVRRWKGGFKNKNGRDDCETVITADQSYDSFQSLTACKGARGSIYRDTSRYSRAR